jgi:hypothetical protein
MRNFLGNEWAVARKECFMCVFEDKIVSRLIHSV